MENVGGVLVHTHKPRGCRFGGKEGTRENRSFISLSCAWDGNADAGGGQGVGGVVNEKEKKVVTRDGRGRNL